MKQKETNFPIIMLEIWWVRHGSTDWNDIKRWQGHSNVQLNEQGRMQARFLAERLKGISFTQVWSSDLDRAFETAKTALPDFPPEKIKTDVRLRELNMGAAEGRTWEELSPEIQEKITAWWSDPYNLKFPGTQETLRDVSDKLKSWMHELPEDGRIIVFTHGGLIRTALFDIFGAPNAQCRWGMELGNTGVVRVKYYNNYPVLTAFNDISHLPDYLNLPESQRPPGDNRS